MNDRFYKFSLWLICATMYNTDPIKIIPHVSVFGFLILIATGYLFIRFSFDGGKLSIKKTFCHNSNEVKFLYFICILHFLIAHLFIYKDPSQGLSVLFTLLPSFLLMLLIDCYPTRNYYNLINAFYWGCQVHVFYGFFQLCFALTGKVFEPLGNVILIPGHLIRISGLFLDANAFGIVVVVALSGSLFNFFIYKGSKKLRFCYLFFYLINIATCLGTASRTTIIISLIMSFYIFQRFYSHKLIKYASFLSVLLIFFFFHNSIIEIFDTLSIFLGRGDIQLSEDIRFEHLWKDYALAFFSSPFWGNGVSQLKNIFSLESHNYILSILAYFGISGFVWYFLPIAYSLTNIMKKSTSSKYIVPFGLILITSFMLANLGIATWSNRPPLILSYILLGYSKKLTNDCRYKTSI